MFAQFQKKPRLHDSKQITHRIRPGEVSSSDVLVSPESVYRSRTVLYRGLEQNRDAPPEERAPLIQTLGLLEFTNGHEMLGSSLIEVAVHEYASLRPVLSWRRIRQVRKTQILANPERVQAMRKSVLARFATSLNWNRFVMKDPIKTCSLSERDWWRGENIFAFRGERTKTSVFAKQFE